MLHVRKANSSKNWSSWKKKGVILMRYEVQCQLEILEEMIENGELDRLGSYDFFNEWDWEDEHSHNEIDEFKYDFNEVAEDLLKTEFGGRYLIRESTVITKQFHKDEITMKSHWTEC